METTNKQALGKEVSVEDVLYTLSKWHIESTSPFNDGYTATNYISRIYKIQELLDRLKKPKVVT